MEPVWWPRGANAREASKWGGGGRARSVIRPTQRRRRRAEAPAPTAAAALAAATAGREYPGTWPARCQRDFVQKVSNFQIIYALTFLYLFN